MATESCSDLIVEGNHTDGPQEPAGTISADFARVLKILLVGCAMSANSILYRRIFPLFLEDVPLYMMAKMIRDSEEADEA
jgi:hypothetical protein